VEVYHTINDALVNLVNEIWKQEERGLITDEFKDITVNDMHIIENIGLEGGKNMSAIAKKLDITVGSLTTSMNSLVNKGYVIRQRSEEDRRVVYTCLTEKGERAYHHHAAYHKEMIDTATETLSEEEIEILTRTLKGLIKFFRGYGAQM